MWKLGLLLLMGWGAQTWEWVSRWYVSLEVTQADEVTRAPNMAWLRSSAYTNTWTKGKPGKSTFQTSEDYSTKTNSFHCTHQLWCNYREMEDTPLWNTTDGPTWRCGACQAVRLPFRWQRCPEVSCPDRCCPRHTAACLSTQAKVERKNNFVPSLWPE